MNQIFGFLCQFVIEPRLPVFVNLGLSSCIMYYQKANEVIYNLHRVTTFSDYFLPCKQCTVFSRQSTAVLFVDLVSEKQ